ncbi:MAG: hypothetical protein Q7T05_06450 [Dehalococcoidia bacterium]|nr:hypothetical protein [Dehalococcoidia bacterium]
MIKHKRISALFIVLIVVAGVLATTGVALAGWVWCDDPVLNIGGTNVYVRYEANIKGQDVPLAGNFAVEAQVGVPEGVNPDNVVTDLHGWTISVYPDQELGKNDFALKVTVQQISTVKASGIKVSVSLDPNGTNVVGTGKVGESIDLLLHIGQDGITKVRHSHD